MVNTLSGRYRRSALRRSFTTAVLMAIAMVATALTAQAAIADKRNDYNRDGFSDVVAINASSGCLFRWFGAGNGGFGGAVQVGCGWDPYMGSLAGPGDINGDRNGDLVAINESTGCLFRWLGNGSGGFGTGVQVGCGWDPYENALAAAGDLNNDGHGDLLAVNSGTNCLFRWFGNGSGGFGAGTQVGCGWDPYKRSLTGVGDFNNDGNADIVAINSGTNCLFRWFGNGSGGFGTGTQVGCGWGPYNAPGNITGMGALNGDSIGDLVAINISTGTDCLYRWFGNGSGGFGAGAQVGCGWDEYYLST